ncbi:hypothetical protein ACO1ZL_24870 [Escherichia coli]|uniref:hypothetical protein n=1 Tax=Escherichia coli TaxID=562 RepID=UPI003B549D0B
MHNTKWSKQRTTIKNQGGRSDGLYNAPKRSPLTDMLPVGETKVIPIDFHVPHAKF